MRIILPKASVDVEHQYGPIFFLAGPILGAPDHQTKSCLLLERQLPNCYIANPRQYRGVNPLEKHRVRGDETFFMRVRHWERFYLDSAAYSGCIIFWLARESLVHPRADGKPYAMDTRRELAEWLGRLKNEKDASVVIGAQKRFPELENIQDDYRRVLGSDFPFYTTQEETIAAAVAKVR